VFAFKVFETAFHSLSIKPLLIVFKFTFCVVYQQELQDGEDVARCPSCSLIIRVIYDLASEFLLTYLNYYFHTMSDVVILYAALVS